jgi:hypothetical protein
MRVVRETCAREGTIYAVGTKASGVLALFMHTLEDPWSNRPGSREAIQQMNALYEHLTPYLQDDHTLFARELLRGRSWAFRRMCDLGEDFTQTLQRGERLVADCVQLLGQDHHDTLDFCNNLCHAYVRAGEFNKAISLGERTLADRERILGETHPATLTSRSNLDSAYQKAGGSGTPRPEQ